jgi:diaminohydroxyphosphoribosylaminopyrimidine deaminase / 5-amino-6-(5-phosphoribosylamino)uracil reductase
MTQPSQADLQWMRRAIELSRLCPQVPNAYSVGAVVVGRDGNELATGISRETDQAVHAEESALEKLARRGESAAGLTIYSTLEPCSERKSRPLSCTRLILDAGIARVVIAWREPDLFVADCQGVELLAVAGVEVVEVPELAPAARAVNAHLGARIQPS